MFETISVTLTRYELGEADRFGNPAMVAQTAETVDGVIVDSPTTEDLEAARPYGAAVSFVLHWPIDYANSLKHAEVTLPAPWSGTYRVIGDPKPLMAENNPLPYFKVMVGGASG